MNRRQALITLLAQEPDRNCETEAVSLFFPPEGMLGPEVADYEAVAKRICIGCPALNLCREAGQSEPYGVWGGTGPAERGYGEMVPEGLVTTAA